MKRHGQQLNKESILPDDVRLSTFEQFSLSIFLERFELAGRRWLNRLDTTDEQTRTEKNLSEKLNGQSSM